LVHPDHIHRRDRPGHDGRRRSLADFNFAFALLQIPLGIIGVPLGIVVLPSLSRERGGRRGGSFARC
jgi:peptidoglycan biosynthesis protein MviN/MurJ (putative lipid II flippase)